MFSSLGSCAEYLGTNPNGGGSGDPNGRDILTRIGDAVRNPSGGQEPKGSDQGGSAGTGASIVTSDPSSAPLTVYTPGAGREVNFPMVNPYRPITDTRSPVSGMNAFPRGKLRDRRYYGFEGFSENSRARYVNAEKPFRPLGFFDPFDPGDIGTSPVSPSPSYRAPSIPGAPSTLQTVLDTIRVTLPATISAVKGQPYYNPAQAAQQYPTVNGQPVQTGAPGSQIGAQTGAALGNLGDTFGAIVAQHPYLVMGGGVALLLLFMNPPRRGR